MKQSHRNLANAHAKAEKLSRGKPAMSKYEAKLRREAEARASREGRPNA